MFTDNSWKSWLFRLVGSQERLTLSSSRWHAPSTVDEQNTPLFQTLDILTAVPTKIGQRKDLPVSPIQLPREQKNMVSSSAQALHNDLKFLMELSDYNNVVFKDDITSTVHRHLWHLSESLIDLTFFDDEVEAV